MCKNWPTIANHRCYMQLYYVYGIDISFGSEVRLLHKLILSHNCKGKLVFTIAKCQTLGTRNLSWRVTVQGSPENLHHGICSAMAGYPRRLSLTVLYHIIKGGVISNYIAMNRECLPSRFYMSLTLLVESLSAHWQILQVPFHVLKWLLTKPPFDRWMVIRTTFKTGLKKSLDPP